MILSSRYFRKSLASTLAVALLVEIALPAVAFAAPPSFTASQTTASAPSIAQVVSFNIPETLTGGDVVSLDIDGTSVTQSFDTSHEITLDFLKTRINGMFSGSGIIAERSGDTFTVSSHSGGIVVGNVQLSHDPLASNERIANVVAQAREVEFPVNPAIIPGDTISIVVDGSGFLVPYSVSASNTLDSLALAISGSTNVSAEYVSGSGTLHLTAKTPGTTFSASNLRVVSAGISPAHIQENVVPVAQVDTVTLPRALYAGENVSLTVSGSVVSTPFAGTTADTLTAFATQISALPSVAATVSGSTLSLTSKTAGTPFTTSSLSITGGTLPIFSIPAEKQKEMIVMSRDFVVGDTLLGSVNGNAISQAFSTSSSGTIAAFASSIDSLSGVTATVDLVGGFPVIYIESEVAGKAFTMGTFSVVTNLAFTVTPATPAVAQVDTITLPRALVAGDRVDVTLAGSTVSKTFSGSAASTLQDIALALSSVSSSLVSVIASGNTLTAQSLVPGTAFVLGNAVITNLVSPNVLDAGSDPVREEHTLSLPSLLSDNDAVSLTVNGQNVSTLYSAGLGVSGTLSALATQISSIPNAGANVDASGALHVYSTITGGSVTVSDLTVSDTNSVVTQVSTGSTEVRATITPTLYDISMLSGTWVIGNCSIFFGTGVSADYNCADGSASVEVLSDTGSIAALLRGISGITYGTSNIPLVSSGSDDVVEYVRASTQTDTEVISSDAMAVAGISAIANTPVVASPDTATVVFQRDFQMGDQISIDFGTGKITQSFVSDQATTLSGVVSLLSGLSVVQSVTATDSHTLALSLNIGTSLPTVSIVNTVRGQVLSLPDAGAKEKIAVDFNSDFVSGDHIALEVNGTPVSADFTTDSTATLVGLANSITGAVNTVDVTASGSKSLVIASKLAGENTLSVTNISVRGGASVVELTPNDAGIPSVADFIYPFTPSASDVLAFTYSGVTVTQAYDTDADKTLLSLSNTIANTFSGSFATSFNPATKALRFVANNVNTSLASATFSATGAISTTTEQVNVEQSADITFSRSLVSGDTLSVLINGTPVSATFSVDEDATITNWCASIDALSGVTCIPNVLVSPKKISLGLESPEAGPFTLSGLTVTTDVPVTNLVPNVVAVSEIRDIVFPRTLVTGDAVSFDLDGQSIAYSFSGSNDETLSGIVSEIGALPGVLASAQFISSTTIRLVAKTAGVAFALPGPVTVINTLPNPTELKPNIVAVAQETDVALPTFVTGDTLSITVDGSGVTQVVGADTSAALTSFVANIDALPNVGASLSGSTLVIVSSTPGRSFAVSTLSRVNSIPVTVQQVFVPAVSQAVQMTVGGVKKGWTYAATINGRNYSYLTNSGDTDDSVVNTLATAMLVDPDVNISTGSTDIIATAKIAGTPFTYSASALDLTAPVVTTPIAVPEILKTGNTSASTVSIDEDGAIYFVLSGATVATYSDIITQVGLWNAFLAVSPATADTEYSVTVPSGINDGFYNIVAVDNAVPSRNVSASYPGWLTVDNTAPALTIHTPSGATTSATGITLTGTTEPNTLVTASGASYFATGTSDVSGNFSFDLPLTLNSVNTFAVSATDVAGNVSTHAFMATQDSINPILTISTPSPLYISGATADVAGTTEAGLTVDISEAWSGVIASVVADGSGAFSVAVTPATNSITIYDVTVRDAANNTSTGSVQVIQDSVNPGVSLSPLPSIIDADSIVVSGITDPSIAVSVSNGAFSTGATTDGSGVFSFTVPLTQNATNSIVVTSTDLSGRMGSASATIVEDSIANTLSLSGGNTTINADFYTLSGTTKPGASLSLTGTAGAFTGTADSMGHFEFVLPLVQDSVNTFDITSIDALANAASGTMVITEDSISPLVSLSTLAHTTYATWVVLAGTTEPLTSVVVTGGSGSFSTVSDGSGAFSVAVDLNLNSANILIATATDVAGNAGAGSVIITQDSTPVYVNLDQSGSYTQSGATFVLSGTAKPNADYIIGGGVIVYTGTISASGTFSVPVNLTTNTTNSLVIAVSDAVTTATGGVTVIVDTLPPTLSFTGVPTSVNTPTVSFTTLSEAGASVVFTNGSGVTFSGTVDGSGILATTLPLALDILNTFAVSASDTLGNTSTGSVAILQDSTAPTVSGVTVTTALNGSVASLDYAFSLSETGSTVFMVGTGSNVAATLVASGSTLSGTIAPLQPNTDYYYQIQATDLLGNTSLTAPASVRTPVIPVVPPTPTPTPAPSSGGSGGSGAGSGGAGLVYYDYCPGGDLSGDYHDNKCSAPVVASSGSTSGGSSSAGGSNGSQNGGSTSTTTTTNHTTTHTPTPTTTTTQTPTPVVTPSHPTTPVADGTTPDTSIASSNKKNDTSISMTPVSELQGFEKDQYIFVEHVVIVREKPNFASTAVAYLPRNASVEVLAWGKNWSFVKLSAGATAYIRSVFLRTKLPADDARSLPFSMLQNSTDGKILDLRRKVRISHSIFVREDADYDSAVKTWLYDGAETYVLDTVGNWSEVRYNDGTGFVRTKYLMK